LITTRGSSCCQTPITQAERARIPELEFVSLSIGEEDPPKEWQDAFQYIPETDEERLDRLLTVPDSAVSPPQQAGPVLPTRKKRSSEIIAQDNERLKRSGQVVAQKNKEIHKEDEVAQYFLKVENFNTTFEYRMAQVTELICHAKETEVKLIIENTLKLLSDSIFFNSSLRQRRKLRSSVAVGTSPRDTVLQQQPQKPGRLDKQSSKDMSNLKSRVKLVIRS
jgi:hypothetical protein